MNGAWLWYAPTTWGGGPAQWSVLWFGPRGGLQSLARHTLVCPLGRAAARPLARRAVVRRAVVRAGGGLRFRPVALVRPWFLAAAPAPGRAGGDGLQRGPWRTVLWCAPGGGLRFRPVALVRPWFWAAALAQGVLWCALGKATALEYRPSCRCTPENGL